MDAGADLTLAFAWCVLAGFFMSSGAGGGGILAGIGQISILVVTDPNVIKAANQIHEFASRLVSVPLYHRQKRLVWSLALSFGVGAPVGAVAGSWFSKTYLSDMALYRPVFGLLVALVGARVLYETWLKKAARAPAPDGSQPRTVRFGWGSALVRFGSHDLEYSPLSAALGGFAISFVGAMMGVGGGFLVTPFMTSMLLFPMFLVVGTSLVALMIPLTVSVLTYLALDVAMDWQLIAVEVPGIFAGSLLGPALNRHLNEKALKTCVALVLLAIGVYYLLF